MSLGENIRDLREKRRYTQVELGEMVGITQKHLSSVEKGYKNLSVPLLARIAKALDTTMDSLNSPTTKD